MLSKAESLQLRLNSMQAEIVRLNLAPREDENVDRKLTAVKEQHKVLQQRVMELHQAH